MNKSATPIRIERFNENYVPKTVWVRNDCNKHIKSLGATGAQAPKPEPVLYQAPPTTVKARPMKTVAKQLKAPTATKTATKRTPGQIPNAAEIDRRIKLIDDIVFDDHIPLKKIAFRRVAMFEYLANKMSTMNPGQSFAIDASFRATVAKAVTEANASQLGSKFVTRMVGAKVLRVWRLQ